MPMGHYLSQVSAAAQGSGVISESPEATGGRAVAHDIIEVRKEGKDSKWEKYLNMPSPGLLSK